MFDEEPDGDPHGECRAEIARLDAELAAARAVTVDVCQYLDCPAPNLLAVVTSLYESRVAAVDALAAARAVPADVEAAIESLRRAEEDWRARAIAAEARIAAADKAIEDVSDELDTLHDDIAEYLPAYDIGDDMQPCLANPREVVEYAGHELRRASKDAVRWRKVAPLIEAMREAAKVAHHDYATEDDATVDFRVTGHELIDAVTNLLAATKEP